MMEKKCIYTNKEAKAKDSVLPKKYLGGEPNWANEAPVSIEYKNIKTDDLPNETEMKLNELFKLRELHVLRIKWYDAQIAEIQSSKEIRKKKPTKKKAKKKAKKKEVKKEKEIKQAIKEKDIIESSKKAMEEISKKKMEEVKVNLWD